ncbi:MAG: FAD-dependent oxidoreductase [Oscillospiraceae bacterium]|nr:FAD-dependent oxidoreductase [Oscillospiraceae bacterium]
MISVWSKTAENLSTERPPLNGGIKTDVLIVGGGMAGILTAYRLKNAGVKCVVAEARTVGSGVTKNTTAKITAQHGLIYADLLKRFGAEKAKRYYGSNTRAIASYRELGDRYPCDFEEKTAYVYSVGDRRKLEREAGAYETLRIRGGMGTDLPLPFPTQGAVFMENQAQFNPLKLLYALAREVDVYENTFVRRIDGDTAYTDVGKITAKHIVLATHYPMVNIPGLYFVKLYQHRSYVIALENAAHLDGMFVDEREDGHSFRMYQDLLLVGGGDHRTGKKGGGYEELRGLAAKAYPGARERYSWATQDCMSLDAVPYIGRHRAGAGNLYAAAGFNKWGMTGSMAAAEVLTDMIVHGKSECEELYSPRRSMLTGQLFINLGAAAAGLLTPGGPRCTHMGCKLRFNGVEKTWDCSCHGSRFDESGRVIDNPALRSRFER